MKIRSGFVSNSSSASYFITMTGTREARERMILEACSYVTWNDSFRTRLEEDLVTTTNRINEYSKKSEGWFFNSLDMLKKRKEELEKDIEILTSDTWDHEHGKNLIRIVLKTYGINRHDTETTTSLDQFTSMHNNYTEGMSKVMMELVLMHAFGEDPTIQFNYNIDTNN
jgi:hypothetical protein